MNLWSMSGNLGVGSRGAVRCEQSSVLLTAPGAAWPGPEHLSQMSLLGEPHLPGLDLGKT